MSRGRFVVLEGNDGCGKSTQAGRLVRRLEAAGYAVVATFEPGATELGRDLRQLLLDDELALGPRAEALLMAADRAQHVADVIEPALARGAWVVSDRFVGSSLAYQGVARGLGVDAVAAMNRFATGDLEPDLVVYLTAPLDVLRSRQKAQRDRIESEGGGFLESVSAAYDALARRFGWCVVDATAEPDVVEGRVWRAVEQLVDAEAAP